MVYLYDACDQILDFCHQQLLRKMGRKISWTTVVYQASSPDEVNSFYTPAPLRGRGVYCFTSVRPSKIFFVAFFSVTVDLTMIPPLFGKQEVGIWRVQKRFPQYGIPIWSLWPNIRFLSSIVATPTPQRGRGVYYFTSVRLSVRPSVREKCAYMLNVYKNQQNRQTGIRNLMGPKTVPTIWYTYMTLVTKYQISAINSYWEKCGTKL
jgi:hypothetical protein